MAKNNEAKIKFTADTQELNSQIKSANSTLAALRAGLKLNEAEFKNTGDTVEYYKNKQNLLQKELEENRKKQEALNQKLELAKLTFGENSTEVQELSTKLNRAKTEEQSLITQVSQCENEMQQQVAAAQKEQTALEQLNTEISEQKSKLEALKTEYKNIVLEQGSSSDEAQELKSKINQLNSELEQNEQKLSDVDNELKDVGNAADKAGQSAESSANGGWSTAKQIFADLASNAIQQCTDKLKDVAKESIEAASNMEAISSQFSQVFGDLENTASQNLSKIADSTGVVENRMKESYTKIAAFAKTTGMDTSDALGLADRAMVAIADSAAFYDRTLEETTESLQSFLKGNYENDAALGLSCTETTRNAAANQLYGKSFKDLSEQQKQLTLLQMVEDANALSGALGQSARETDTWTNQTGNLQQAWEDVKANLGSAVLSEVVEIVKSLSTAMQDVAGKVDEWKPKIQDVINDLKSAYGWMQEHKTMLGIIASVIAIVTTAMILQSAAQAATSAIQTAKTTANLAETASLWSLVAAQTAALAPYIAIVAAIAAVIAIIVVCVKHWDEIKAKVTEVADSAKQKVTDMKENVSGKFEELKGNVTGVIDGVKDKFNTVVGFFKNNWKELLLLIVNPFAGAFALLYKHNDNFRAKVDELKNKVVSIFLSMTDKVKSLFGGMKLSFPNIKMPHFKVTPSGWKIGDLLEGSIPKLGIEWYAKGAVFQKPTLFNTAYGLKGVGEAGAEAVAPINVLQSYVQDSVDASLASYMWIDYDLLGAKVALACAKMNITVDVDGREFGRVVRSVI